jgi:hypothetical protein
MSYLHIQQDPTAGSFELGQARSAAQPARPRFRIDCPAGCPPIAAAQCRTVLRQAIREAIKIANNAASKLEASPRDAETVRLFRFFFGHSPSRPIPWAGNRASGANVAHRLRKVAEGLQTRGTLFRCGCPGAPAGRRAQVRPGTAPNVIELCTRFWNPPAGLRGLPDPAFRAGVIIHEMLHLLYRDFLVHSTRRANAHCYEAFVLRVAGYGADPSDVTQCRS